MTEISKYGFYPLLSVCTILVALRNGKISVLLVKYADNKNFWSLPTGMLKQDESLDQCAKRELKEKIGIDVAYITHFSNYSEPAPSSKKRVVTIAYLAAHHSEKLRLKANSDILDLNWFNTKNLPKFYLNHGIICHDGINYSKSLIKYEPALAFGFHKNGFTLSELQKTYAAFGDRKFSAENKRNFRLWVKNYCDGKGLVVETDKYREGNHRPARIYEPNLKVLDEKNKK